MILKPYQQTVIDDLSRFLELLDKNKPVSQSFSEFWDEKKDGLAMLMPHYRDVLPGVPSICLKVPTGGGKTFIASCAIKPLFDNIPIATKAVVWLVPSDSILEQTIKSLSEPHHPYRQRINTDFSHRVSVYTKSQLLNGQNFNPTVVNEQLSVFVLSYDSFRTKNKEGRKVYQQNGCLAEFAKFFNDPSILLADTDETALIQVIRYLNPAVIVDESHNATSSLSREMLQNFNPSFVIELTATPKSESNILSYVSANALKAANMVKLPVIVYNRRTKEDVIIQAIDTRNKLEKMAIAEQKKSKRYIRPIVLFQAEPRTGDTASTFEKIKEGLIKLNIPANHIAIKTAEKNELKGIDLLSEDCPIRYIITVNALKEGWDCPFAYILATIANRSSQVDVEQILGRVLRLPHTKKNECEFLNISYVYTSSNAFQETIKSVVAGLVGAGFTDKDYRAPDISDIPEKQEEPPAPTQQIDLLTALPAPEIESDTDFDITAIKQALEQRDTEDVTPTIEEMPDFSEALTQINEYNETNKTEESPDVTVPPEVKEKMKSFRIISAFADEVNNLRLPQFVVPMTDISMFDSTSKLLTAEDLYTGFSLLGKNAEIDFTNIDAEIARVDTDPNSGDVPKAWKLTLWGNPSYREFFDSLPPEKKIAQCKETIVALLTKDDALSQSGLVEYVGRIIAGFTSEQLEDLQQSPYNYYPKIKKKIENLRAEHTESMFNLWIETGKITCELTYGFPQTISPSRYTSALPKTLYTAEEEMNGLEKDLAWELANRPNIKWWHRNISRSGFAINGYVVDGNPNAYPDIIAMTESGKILVIEPKGDYLDGTNAQHKVKIGRKWQNEANKAGDRYRYYMVFREKDLKVDGAVRFDRFLEILEGL
jgi:type III restriction enzyme